MCRMCCKEGAWLDSAPLLSRRHQTQLQRIYDCESSTAAAQISSRLRGQLHLLRSDAWADAHDR